MILNPGISQFKEFTGLVGKDSQFIRRKANFLIFSIYEDASNDSKYIGVLMNFINIYTKPLPPPPPPDPNRVIVDTLKK